jgi:hypothetical protein
MAWLDAKITFEWRQGASRQDIKDGQFNPALLVDRGAISVLKHMRHKADAPKWLVAILARRPFKVVATALANKMARIIWALLTSLKAEHIENLVW